MKKKEEIQSYTAKTVAGLEESLKSELEAMGASGIKVLTRGVSFSGNHELLYKANYCCRTALRILKPVATFTIQKQDDLYSSVREFPWEEVMEKTGTLAIDSVNSNSVFTNTQFISQRAKDAIADRFRDRTGVRPSVDLEDPDLRINVYISREACTLSLDSSGSSLHKRGYRKLQGVAPLNEVLAAGIVQLSGWDRDSLLYDPMCGSGTLLIEAGMAAKSVPAGYFRNGFGFMKWKDYDAGLWRAVKEKAGDAILDKPVPLFGSDISPRVVRNAEENIARAGFAGDISLNAVAFENSDPPGPSGTIVCNPPYDERLQLDDTVGFYRMIGDVLKRKYKGYQAWFISSDLKALKFIGLHPSKKIVLYNGPLECRFVKFDVY
jgi:putative N6-adenine-specific DNA methylase